MSFYDEMALVASELIAEYGQNVFIVRDYNTTDPVTGEVTEGNGAPYLVKGILKMYPDNLIDGTRIKTSDRELVIDGSIEPLMNDRIEINRQEWSVQSIKTANPGGTPLVYFVQVRR